MSCLFDSWEMELKNCLEHCECKYVTSLAVVTLYYIMTILLKTYQNWLSIFIELHILCQILLFKMGILHRIADRPFSGVRIVEKTSCINKLQSLIRQESNHEINYEFTTVCSLLIKSKYNF